MAARNSSTTALARSLLRSATATAAPARQFSAVATKAARPAARQSQAALKAALTVRSIDVQCVQNHTENPVRSPVAPRQNQSRGVKTLDFAGTKETVYERADWPVPKLQEYFKNDTLALIGYGSQGEWEMLLFALRTFCKC